MMNAVKGTTRPREKGEIVSLSPLKDSNFGPNHNKETKFKFGNFWKFGK